MSHYIYGPFVSEDEAYDYGATLRRQVHGPNWAYARLRRPPIAGYFFLNSTYCDDTCVAQDLPPITAHILLGMCSSGRADSKERGPTPDPADPASLPGWLVRAFVDPVWMF